MAFKAYIYGVKAVVKASAGRPFLSRAVAWQDNPSAMPAAVRARTEAFKKAVPACRSQSKSKAGTVWGVSKYNRCIGDALS